MKKGLQLLGLLLTCFSSFAQVKINSNRSLEFEGALGNNKALYVSAIDKTLWVSDGTAAGTFQLSSTIRYEDAGGVLDNKLIFSGTTPGTGTELFITDGTVAGTTLVKDIMPGTEGSLPDDDFALLNGYLYFTAVSPGIGRELWRTNGTLNGTTLVKDIIEGPAQSSMPGNYDIFSTGNYLLLRIPTTAEGLELWKSDGTAGGTVLLKDINPGSASSQPGNFYLYNNMVLFTATHAQYGKEIWRTDGTEQGTQLVKDIREGSSGSVGFILFYQFNGRAYFSANNGTTGDEIWSTDGTADNTRLLKDIQPGELSSYAQLFTAVSYGNKFIFTAYHQNYDFELWESDGTTEGTKLFKEVAPGPLSAMIYTLPPFDFTNGTVGQSLFQGNKFFMMVVLPNVGTELWVCNGTAEGTVRVKNINTDEDDGLSNLSYVYSTSGLYFAANDGVHGDELWKSDATETGTERITDINPGIADADISVSFMKVNNKILFNATDGDHLTAHDLYALELGSTLPVKLLDFTVSTKLNDALLQWSTSQEINSKDFTVERSFDGKNFSTIGTVKATGSSSSKKEYSYTDKDVLASGKEVVYYRLLINDRDGKSVTSKVISVKIKGTAEWNIKLVNNPVVSNMVLALSGITDNVQLSIKDVTGKTVHNAGRFNSNGQVSVAADRLTPGIYILVAETNSERKTIRFVKQ